MIINKLYLYIGGGRTGRKGEDSRIEELTIQFLVLEGLSRLEAGNVFDLKNELDFRMDEAEHALWRRENMQRFLYLLEGLVGLAGMVLVVLLFLLL